MKLWSGQVSDQILRVPFDNEEIHFKMKCLLMLMLCVNSFLMINFSLKGKHCVCSQNIALFDNRHNFFPINFSSIQFGLFIRNNPLRYTISFSMGSQHTV